MAGLWYDVRHLRGGEPALKTQGKAADLQELAQTGRRLNHQALSRGVKPGCTALPLSSTAYCQLNQIVYSVSVRTQRANWYPKLPPWDMGQTQMYGSVKQCTASSSCS